MGFLVLFAVCVLACAVPDAAPAVLGIARYPPDLFVAVAAWLGMRGRGAGALAGAVFLGCLRDFASLDPLGTHAFVLGAVAFLFLRPDRVHAPTGPARALLVGLACVLAHGLLLLRLLVMSKDAPAFDSFGGAFPTALWTALVSWPLLSLLDRAHLLDDLAGARRGVST